VAIAAVRRLAANGAIWVIGGFNESNGSKDKGANFVLNHGPASMKVNLLSESKTLCFQRVAEPRNGAIVR